MKKTTFAFAAGAILTMSSAAIAQERGEEANAETQETSAEQRNAENTSAADEQAEDPNERVCRKLEITGSLVKRRLCKTRAQWAAIAEQENREARRVVDHANQGSTNGR